MPRTFVSSSTAIRNSISTFRSDMLASTDNTELALKSVRQTSLWVFDPATKDFGPGKFVGFDGMTYDDYRDSLAGVLGGDRFDGHWTRGAIEKILGSFHPDAVLAKELQVWASSKLGPLVFKGIDTSKWMFVSLPLSKSASTTQSSP